MSGENFLIDYTAYMRSLAEKHKKLQHSNSNKHFFRGELQEFFENLRSVVKFPCLVLESNEVEYIGKQPNVSKNRTTSFIIVDSYNLVGDFGEMDLKWSGCEMVAEQIIGRMITDKVKPFQRIEAESITGEYMANTAQKYVGYRVTLTLTDCSICMFDKNAWLNEED